MGANFDCRVFDVADRKAVSKKWFDAVEQSSWDDGHQYSGCIGMMSGEIVWRDLLLPSPAAAADYVESHHEKWEPPIAASYSKDGKVGWVVGGLCAS